MPIYTAILRLALYSLLLASTYWATLYNVSQGAIKDNYFSELPQNILLFAIIGLAFGTARVYPAGRAVMTSIGIFFVACLIREFDNELDAWFFFGAWKIPGFAVGFLLLYYVYRNWGRLGTDMRWIGESLAFGVWSIGLVLLMVFSRMWGGNQMWRYLMPADYNRTLVRVSEEGIELMAYAVIFAGMVELALLAQRRTDRHLNTPTYVE